jgi:peptidyl-prolyl cis-trans isomerase C
MIPQLRAGALVLALLLGACGDNEEGEAAGAMPDFSELNEDVAGDVVAVVNGQHIDSVSFQSRARREKAEDPAGLSLEEKQRVLDSMVEEALLYQEAKRQNLDTHDDIRKRMIDLLLQQEVGAKVSTSDISDAEGESFFEANKERFYEPARINLRMITIRIRDGEEAAAQARIDDLHTDLSLAQAAEREARGAPGSTELIPFGKVFRDTAISNSEDSFRGRGGDVNWVEQTGRPAVPQAVMDRAFQLPVDGLSEPIQSDTGWHIIWVKQRNEAKKLTYQQYRTAVLRELKDLKQQERKAELLATLRGKSSVTIDQDVLAAQQVRGQSSGRPSKTEE